MACIKCKDTDCIISDSFKLKDGTEIFADLRFDLENNQLDIQYGTLDKKDKCSLESEWTHSIDIKYCMFCGDKLQEIV